MHISICIVSFRNAGDVVGCLAALAKSTHVEFDVVICENGGPEAQATLERAAPRQLPGGQAVRILGAPGNVGYAGGVNIALEAAPTADAWWVLNPDTEPQPEALAALIRRLAAGDCDLVGGTLCTPAGRVEARAGLWRPWLARTETIGYDDDLDAPVDTARIERAAGYVSGACMLVSRRFLETVGPMREDYFLYCEEVEWCLRGLRHGLALGYAADARVLHHKGTTTGATEDMGKRSRMPVFLDERNKILMTRDLYPRRLPVAAVAAFLLLLLRFGKRRAWRQVGYAIQGWYAGLRNRRGAPDWVAV